MAPHSDPTPFSSPVLGTDHGHSEVPQHGGSDLVEPSENSHPGPGLDLGLGAVELWLDPFGGMAGDMFLAGLLDMGKPQFGLGHLQDLAEDLLPGEARLTSSRVLRQGIAGQHLEVRTPESDSAPHRGLSDLLARIEASSLLNARAKELAGLVLKRLAQAEGQVHGQSPESIHFHEVGAVDTLVDVCGAAYAMQLLGVSRLYVRPPLLGSGTVKCAHGILPVPPPATAALLRGWPVRMGGGGGERVTPTGAAVIAAWGTLDHDTQPRVLQGIGYGAGTRDPKPDQGPANLLRVLYTESEEVLEKASIWQMEVNLDDMTGEDLGHCVTALREAGALDVWTASIDMKKDRPGTLLALLVQSAHRATMEELVFRHTSTFGLRWTPVERTECDRRFESRVIEGIEVRFKIRMRPGGGPGVLASDVFPEFEDLRKLASAWDEPLWEARRRAIGLFLNSGSA